MKNFLTLALALTTAYTWAQPNLTPVFVECTAGEYPNEISWTIYTCDSTEILQGGAPFFGAGQFPDPDRFIIHMEDSYGDGWNGAYLIVGETPYGFLSEVNGSTPWVHGHRISQSCGLRLGAMTPSLPSLK